MALQLHALRSGAFLARSSESDAPQPSPAAPSKVARKPVAGGSLLQDAMAFITGDRDYVAPDVAIVAASHYPSGVAPDRALNASVASMHAAAAGKPVTAAHAANALALHSALQAACAEEHTRFGAFHSVSAAPAATLERCSPSALSSLQKLLAINAAPDFCSTANALQWHEAMTQLGDDCYAMPAETACRVGVVYYIDVALPARAWAAEIARLDGGDYSSRMRAGVTCPPSYVGMIHALRAIVQHHCRDGGNADTLISVFYIGMSNASNVIARILAHGSSNGCPAIHQVYARTAPMKARTFHGFKPIVRRRIVGYTLPATQSGGGSPAASLEALVGAACLALQPLRPCGGTSPHGDEALLFHERLRPGHVAVAPLALSFLHSSALALGDAWTLATPTSEPQELMRAHLMLAADILRRAKTDDSIVTLREAWVALLGGSAVSTVLASARRAAAYRDAVTVTDITHIASVGATAAASIAASPGHAGILSESSPLNSSPLSSEPSAVAKAAAAALVAIANGSSDAPSMLDTAVAAFCARAHLRDETLRVLLTVMQPAASASRELLAAIGLPVRLTPGALRVTECDIDNWRDAARRRERGGVPVDEHLLNVLLGELQEFGWAHTECSMDAQGAIVSLRTVICSPQQREAYSSHPHIRLVRVMDATFGVAGSDYEFFVVIHVHPPTLLSLPLAFFIRKAGTRDDPHAPGQKIADLAWCERTLRRFGFRPAAITMVDKCAASLGAWLVSLKESWAAAVQVPALGPCTAASGAGEPSIPAVRALLAHVSEGCSADDAKGLYAYLAHHIPGIDFTAAMRAFSPNLAAPPIEASEDDVPSLVAVGSDGSSNLLGVAAGPGNSGASGAARDGRSPAPFADELFGLWGESHPQLVRPLAALLSFELQAAASLVAVADGVVAADLALSRLSALAPFVADGDTALSQLIRDLVERLIRLCYFHAQKAMLEHTSRMHTLPAAQLARWKDDVKPAIARLFGASVEELQACWEAFQVQFGAYPAFIAYMEDNWMSAKWRFLWTGAGRHHLARFLIDTSNYAEIFFRVGKRELLHNRMPSDPVVFLEKLIGLPTKPSSIQVSYVMQKLINISDIMGGRTNMARPARGRVDDLRDAVSDILACDGAIVPVSAYEYKVASRNARVVLRAGSDASGLPHYLVSLYHGCPCSAPAAHCPHVLACRARHLQMGRLRCWRDAELSAIVPLELPSSLRSVAELLQVDAAVPTEASAETCNAAHATQRSAVCALAESVATELAALISAPTPTPLLASATSASIVARTIETAVLARTSRALASVLAALGGGTRTATGGRQSLPPSARTSAEVDAQRRSAPIMYRGGSAAAPVAIVSSSAMTDPAAAAAASALASLFASARASSAVSAPAATAAGTGAAATAAGAGAAARPTRGRTTSSGAGAAATAAGTDAAARPTRGRSRGDEGTPHRGGARQRRRKHAPSPSPSPPDLRRITDGVAAMAVRAYEGARTVQSSIRWAVRDATAASAASAATEASQHVAAMRIEAERAGHMGPW